jgi:hypothetical protein
MDVLSIAVRKGRFEVSWRYRDDALRRKCHRLVNRGLLHRIHAPAGSSVFVPTGQGRFEAALL